MILKSAKVLLCVLALTSFLGGVPVRAATRQRVMILALDQSKSMRVSDPLALRGEAAGLLAATLNPDDQVGVIVFGDKAEWVQGAEPVARGRLNFEQFGQIAARDNNTAFAPVLDRVDEYLRSQPEAFFASHEVSLVLLTDGESDPPGERGGEPRAALAEADWQKVFATLSRQAGRLTVYTVGLGASSAYDPAKLKAVAETTGGFFLPARSANDLPDAFLRVAARAAGLPVYQRFEVPAQLTWEGTPRRVLGLFTGAGESAASFRLAGRELYRSRHVAAIELTPSDGRAAAAWEGKGTVFLGVQEPLTLATREVFPGAMLTDARHPVSLSVQSDHGALGKEYFLQKAEASLELAGSNTAPVALVRQSDAGIFAGDFQAEASGKFRLLAHLDSLYGRIDTFLGDLIATTTPVALPEQLELSFYDPLPRGWFARKVKLESILGVGAVDLHFAANAAGDRYTQDYRVEPGRPAELRLVAAGGPAEIHPLDYTATWSDGKTQGTRRGSLRLSTRQMSFAELLGAKWGWLMGFLLGLAVLVAAAFRYWPRPLRGVVTVKRNGAQIVRLHLPSELRSRTLRLSEGDGGGVSAGDHVVIAGEKVRELLSLRSARFRGRWTILARTHAAHLPLSKSKGPAVQRPGAEVDLRAIYVPVFSTDDGVIQINVVRN